MDKRRTQLASFLRTKTRSCHDSWEGQFKFCQCDGSQAAGCPNRQTVTSGKVCWPCLRMHSKPIHLEVWGVFKVYSIQWHLLNLKFLTSDHKRRFSLQRPSDWLSSSKTKNPGRTAGWWQCHIVCWKNMKQLSEAPSHQGEVQTWSSCWQQLDTVLKGSYWSQQQEDFNCVNWTVVWMAVLKEDNFARQ